MLKYQVGDKVNATSMPSNNLPVEDDHAIILEFSCCVQYNLTSLFAARKKTKSDVDGVVVVEDFRNILNSQHAII